MGLQVAVAGSTRTTNAKVQTLSITSSIRSRASFAELAMFSTDAASWRPKAGNEIVISTTSDSSRHFAGVILRVSESAQNRQTFDYFLDCKDYTWLFDRRLVAKNYGSSSGAAILADIVTTFTSGFSTAGIQNLGSISAQRFDYVAPSECFTQIANYQQAHWYIDYDKVVQYFSAITNVAPTTAINVDNSTAYADLTLEEDASNVRNRIVLQGYKVASNVQFNRTFSGDSSTRFFYLGYEPVDTSTGNISVTVDGVSVTAKIDVIDAEPGTTQGTSTECYVCFSNMGLRFSTGVAAPTSTVAVNFNYLKDGGIQYDDAAAQTEMISRSSGDGVHMHIVNDPGLTNRSNNDDFATAMGAAITQVYGKPVLSGVFTSYTQGWRAGQYLTMSSTRRMGGFDKTMYVYQVTKRVVSHPSGGSPTFVHEVSVADTPIVP